MSGKRARGQGVAIRREELTSAAARTLVEALNRELSARYPEAGATHFRLEPEEVAEGQGAFLVAYDGDKAVGCGAVRRLRGGTAEIKRMYVDPAVRGRGIGRRILEVLEAEARRLGARRLVLETGVRQVEAMGLYAEAGFSRIPAFGEYVGSPLSLCMGKAIDPA